MWHDGVYTIVKCVSDDIVSLHDMFYLVARSDISVSRDNFSTSEKIFYHRQYGFLVIIEQTSE